MKKLKTTLWNFCSFSIVACLTTVLTSCIYPVSTPQEAFISHMKYNIGRNIDKPSTNWVGSENFIDSRSLNNGNNEYGYRWRGSCRYYFEVNPKTHIIVGWRLENEQDCKLNPV